MTARKVSVELIPPSVKASEPRLRPYTFAVVLRTGGPGVEVLAVDDDVPAGVHPESYGQSVASAAGARWDGLGAGIRFAATDTGWTAWDFLACAPHSQRNCPACTPAVVSVPSVDTAPIRLRVPAKAVA